MGVVVRVGWCVGVWGGVVVRGRLVCWSVGGCVGVWVGVLVCGWVCWSVYFSKTN